MLEQDERRVGAGADVLSDALLQLPGVLVGGEAGPEQGIAGYQRPVFLCVRLRISDVPLT